MLFFIIVVFLSFNLQAAVLNFSLQPEGSTQTVTSEWVQHGHDAQHTNYTDQVVPHPWRWKWSWNGPNASGGIASGHHTLPRNVQPITGGGYVYIADGSNGVRVLNISDGSVVRTISPGGSFNSTPAYDVSDGSLYIASTNGNLYKVNPANGNILGTFNAGSAINYAPCLISDRIFISAGNTVKAVKKSDMTQIWNYDAGSPVVTPPAYSATRNYVVVLTQDLYVHCMTNPASGNATQVWRVKPTNRTYSNASPLPTNAAQAEWGWPVIAEVHGLVLVKYRLDWDTLYTVWSPWPVDNATIRSNLQSRPDQQCMFALDLDDGTNPFICNLGHGGWGDGGYMPMGQMPVVKKFSDGKEIVYAVVRGHTMYDGRWDSHFGEMVLDDTTVPGYQAGYIRYICMIWQTMGSDCNSEYFLTDEQPFITVAGDYLFASHWECAMAASKILDRSDSRGTWTNKITTERCPTLVTSQDDQGQCSFSASHYCPNGLTNTRWYFEGFYIYYGQGSVYDSYWSDYACVVVSNNNIIIRSCDSAIVCLESGNPQASIKQPSRGELAKNRKEEKELIAGYNPSAKDRPATGPEVISYLEAKKHIGEVKTVEGVLKSVFNNGKAVYLGFNNPHNGYFCVRIMKENWKNFGKSPEKIYDEGMRIRVKGKIVWYQNDPVIYATSPKQIKILSRKYLVSKYK